MGSYFLHDDYSNRLADFNNGNSGGMTYKKEPNAMGQSIFENNLCFANIKRGLGFVNSDKDASSTTAGNGNGSVNDTEDWTYDRARSSPVVERLILEEIQNDISEYAVTIGVPMDPKQWCVDDTRKWLHWVSAFYQIGDPTDCLSFDGRTLCGFSEQDFILLTGSEDAGLKIAAQLDLWKNAIRLTPSAGSYHFQQQQQQQAMDQKLGIVTSGRQDNNTPKLLDAGCSWTSARQQFASQSGMLSNNSQFANDGSDNVASTPSGFQVMRNTQYQAYNHHRPQIPSYMNEPQGQNTSRSAMPLPRFPNEPPQGRHTPRPTIPLDRFRSVREACQDSGFLTWEKYQEFTNMTPFKNSQNVMFMSSSTKNNSAMSNTATSQIYNMNKLKEEPVKPAASANLTPKLEVLTPTVSNVEPVEPTTDYTPLNTMTLKTEIMDAETEVQPEATTSKPLATEKAPKKKSSKHPIHLWEFLKQLLFDGKDCIRWIDQEKGVFKIYNSQEVAKFWGERKNRPAMNYDKLSRSIRQYYRKGIIKKTSQGKRLVYQFCQGYL